MSSIHISNDLAVIKEFQKIQFFSDTNEIKVVFTTIPLNPNWPKVEFLIDCEGSWHYCLNITDLTKLTHLGEDTYSIITPLVKLFFKKKV